jgi:hypothetical protein
VELRPVDFEVTFNLCWLALSDVKTQFAQGICILHGQNKAKNEIFDGQIPKQRPGTHRSRVWKMVFEMGI